MWDSEDRRFREALTVADVTLKSKLDVPETNAYVVPNSLDDNISKSRKLVQIEFNFYPFATLLIIIRKIAEHDRIL